MKRQMLLMIQEIEEMTEKDGSRRCRREGRLNHGARSGAEKAVNVGRVR